MRIWCCLLILATTVPAHADPSPPYYGPMKAWKGIGYKFGFKDRVEKDGMWRVDAAVRGGEAVDVAMYRVAERAREEGYAFVEFQGGTGSRSPGYNSATVYARPSASAAPPATCRSSRRTACYTAEVAEVLRVLGGPGGAQPGVPVTDHVDRFGRSVSYSGYGVGAASLAPRFVAPPPPRAISSVTSAIRMPVPVRTAAAVREPVRGRAPDRGWTIGE